MGVIVGREGFGKSHSALSIAKAVDPGFTAEDVYFDPKGLLEAFQSEDYGTGDMIVLDEAGVGLGNRTWYEKGQVLLNQTLQTVRDDNMGVLFTLPRLSELDSQTIGRLHAFLEMTEVRKEQGYALAKWKNVDPARGDRAKTYYKYSELRFDGVPYDLKHIKIGKPPADLVTAYEKRKESFKEGLYEEAIEAQEDEPNKDKSPKDIVDDIGDEALAEVTRAHGRTGEPIVDKDLVRAEFDISHSDARTVKSLLEKHFSDDELSKFI
jgi:ABC-type dipeptide/oligopeptide/nickel transport system ATPase component